MKKSKVMIAFAVVLIVTFTSVTVVTAGNLNVSEKIDQIMKMKKQFDNEYDELSKSKVDGSEQEINNSAAAGDKLKEKGIAIQKMEKEIATEQGSLVPTKDEILSEINFGISMTEEGIENFIKNNPHKSKAESLNARNESNSKQLEILKQLKDDLSNDKISTDNAWNKVLEIRDGKK
ncbi:MAG: hypothetical protein PHR20_09435 [Bacteroidales bacterium]|nr:hypothetical protein [Bacteroidales bacterium]